MEGKPKLSLSRQPFLSTHYWDFGEGTHPRDLLLPSLNKKWGQKDCNPLMPINPVPSRINKFHMGTSFEDTWVTCCFPPPSGKLLLIILGGTVGQSSACQMHHACHLETLAKLLLLLASTVQIIPFSFCLHCILKGASTGKFNSWRPYLITS